MKKKVVTEDYTLGCTRKYKTLWRKWRRVDDQTNLDFSPCEECVKGRWPDESGLSPQGTRFSNTSKKTSMPACVPWIKEWGSPGFRPACVPWRMAPLSNSMCFVEVDLWAEAQSDRSGKGLWRAKLGEKREESLGGRGEAFYIGGPVPIRKSGFPLLF